MMGFSLLEEKYSAVFSDNYYFFLRFCAFCNELNLWNDKKSIQVYNQNLPYFLGWCGCEQCF